MILYKKDTKDKIRFLEIDVLGNILYQISGIVGTINPIKHEKECKGKNLGKSNETTPEQQALQEKESLIKEKLKEGYFKTQLEAETTDILFPMLAKDYKKEEKKIDWSGDVFIQPKLDGMRCLLIVDNKVTLKSRNGRFITTLKHLENVDLPEGIYDGELYAHGYSFQENMEFIKKVCKGTELIRFHCYDLVEDISFAERIEKVNVLQSKYIEIVPTYKIIKNDITNYHSMFLKDGYEGSIIRHGKEGYKINSRSSNLLKYKDFLDISVPILDIIPSESRPEWGTPILKLKDKTFKAGLKYPYAQRKEFLQNKSDYIGKIAEIRFFEYTDDGLPRFPVMVGIRNDKTID